MTIKQRLLSKYEIDSNGCWLFTGYIDELGYGIISRNHIACKAHRISWEVNVGIIPEGLNVLHKCDVRRCINPKHLFLGTQLDNIKDMILKGRKASIRGVLHPSCKLDEAAIVEIRKLLSEGMMQRRIAEKFGVTEQHIYRIKTKRVWAHLA